jgi:hypothetical protein
MKTLSNYQHLIRAAQSIGLNYWLSSMSALKDEGLPYTHDESGEEK